MVIFHPAQEPEAVRSALDRFGSVISERGGSVSRVDTWGRRRLAYEIRHVKDGTYVVLQLQAETEAVSELDRVLSITDEVLRHKIVRLPDTGIPTVAPGVYEESAERHESPRHGGRRSEE
jgi:small subunit ribosomal protein S6